MTTHKPTTPRNIAIWAVVLAYADQGRDTVIRAIVDAGIRDERE